MTDKERKAEYRRLIAKSKKNIGVTIFGAVFLMCLYYIQPHTFFIVFFIIDILAGMFSVCGKRYFEKKLENV